MTFTLEFLRVFALGLTYTAPLLILLVLFIALIGLSVGRREGWSRSDALYYAFITASTVGYGDFHPRQTASKYSAIVIALIGLVLTGLVVALGVQAAGFAFVSLNPQAAETYRALSSV